MLLLAIMSKASHEVVNRYIKDAKLILQNSKEPHEDENVVFAVAALLYHKFNPQKACGGHLSYKTGGNYIDITFPDYDLIMSVHASLKGQRKQLHQNRINHDLSLEELRLILLLNQFYTSREITYENMLVIRRHDNGVLRLQTMQNEIIDELASVDKRREWLIATNEEFFEFGKFLFSHPPKDLTEYLK